MDMRSNSPDNQTSSSTEGSSGDGPPKSNMFRLSIPDLELKQECIEYKLSKASSILKDVSCFVRCFGYVMHMLTVASSVCRMALI